MPRWSHELLQAMPNRPVRHRANSADATAQVQILQRLAASDPKDRNGPARNSIRLIAKSAYGWDIRDSGRNRTPDRLCPRLASASRHGQYRVRAAHPSNRQVGWRHLADKRCPAAFAIRSADRRNALDRPVLD